MIFNMLYGGGGVDLDVQAYASSDVLPLTADENAIAIISETEVSSFVFDKTQPLEPVEGMVWFGINRPTSAHVKFNDDNIISTCIGLAKQYISGAWVSVDTYVYQNSIWKKVLPVLPVLYSAGVFPEGVEQEIFKTPDASAIAYYDAYIGTATATSAASNVTIRFGPLFLGDTESIGATFQVYDSVDGYHYLVIYVSDQPDCLYADAIVSAQVNAAASSINAVTLDVSALDGAYYVYVGQTAGSWSNKRHVRIMSVTQTLSDGTIS